MLQLIEALLRKEQINFQPRVRFLNFADLIDLVGRQKLTLRPGGRDAARAIAPMMKIRFISFSYS